jgi:hypothetical protein
MFDHEKLQVYGKALDFAAKAAAWTSTWDKKHALVDHLSKATESILLNLAEAARQRGTPARLRIVDYAIGSSLECAWCLAEGNGRYAELDHYRFLQIAQSAAVKGAVFLDLGVERAFLVESEATAGKEMLRRISAMVAGF